MTQDLIPVRREDVEACVSHFSDHHKRPTVELRDRLSAALSTPPSAEPVAWADLGWKGSFSVIDPEPENDHSAIYLVCPNGLMVNTSCDPTPGLDARRTQWMADTLNASVHPLPSGDDGGLEWRNSNLFYRSKKVGAVTTYSRLGGYGWQLSYDESEDIYNTADEAKAELESAARAWLSPTIEQSSIVQPSLSESTKDQAQPDLALQVSHHIAHSDKMMGEDVASHAAPQVQRSVGVWQPIETAPPQGGVKVMVGNKHGWMAHCYQTAPDPPLVQTWRYASGPCRGEQAPWPDYWLELPPLPSPSPRKTNSK